MYTIIKDKIEGDKKKRISLNQIVSKGLWLDI